MYSVSGDPYNPGLRGLWPVPPAPAATRGRRLRGHAQDREIHPMKDTYETLIKRLREVHTLGSVRALLGWDQETYMPPRAHARRAEQLALMSEITHRRFTDDAVGELLEALPVDAVAGELGPEAGANVRETARHYGRARKLPADFVAEQARACSHAHEAWIEARKEKDFGRFAPHLETIIGLKQREAEYIGYDEDIYDALLDERAAR
jgi:carboxypeptidase Taq